MMNRREAMKRVAVILGGSLTISTITVFQQGCQRSPERMPGVFSDEDADLLNIIGDIILPPTNTPGAAAVDIGGFAVKMLEDCYSEEARTQVTRFLRETLMDFEDLTPVEQVQKITEIDGFAYSENAQDVENIENGDNAEDEENWEAYKMIKELTLFGYFTSEPGMTEALEYVEIPGRFEGCVELKPGQKAWA